MIPVAAEHGVCVRVYPLSTWAMAKVRQHGDVFLVHRRIANGLIVESLGLTYGDGITWIGRFHDIDVEIEEIVVDYVTCPRCFTRVPVRELRDHLDTCRPEA